MLLLRSLLVVPAVAGLAGLGCSASNSESDTQYQAAVVSGMRTSFITDLSNLVSDSQMLQAAAPTPADRGWDATADATAIANMKAATIVGISF